MKLPLLCHGIDIFRFLPAVEKTLVFLVKNWATGETSITAFKVPILTSVSKAVVGGGVSAKQDSCLVVVGACRFPKAGPYRSK